MKGVVLAGGKGTRPTPLTRIANQHLRPVFDKPMMDSPIQTLADAGSQEIFVVKGWWTGAGAFESLPRASNLVAERRRARH